MSEDAVPSLPKVDPEPFAIRSKPARAIRFRRGVIIAIAALGSVSLMMVAWIALKPRVLSAVADHQELSEPSNRPSADALNGLPATYGDVPKLGPPLPGDLGRPILASQRRMATETDTGNDPSKVQAEQDREHQLAELKAARESGVLVTGGAATSVPVAPDASGTPPPIPAAEVSPGLNAAHDPNTQGRKAQFIGTLDRSGDVNPHTLTAAP